MVHGFSSWTRSGNSGSPASILKNPIVDDRRIRFYILGFKRVLAADRRVEIGRGSFFAFPGREVEPPEAEPLRPAAFPFEIVDERPMIVAGNRDSGGNRAPELVNLIPDIFAAERILVVLDAVFRDDNGLSIRPGPAERVRERIRLVREESGSSISSGTPVGISVQ